MKKHLVIFVCLFLSHVTRSQIADQKTYLADIQAIMKTEWPKNRTVNLVFHGHSVPAGYFKTPTVNTLGAYPFQVLQALKKTYPLAVINLINTSIGGENSISGAKRFDEEVLMHRPDLLFIDYVLNDRGPGLEKAKAAWEEMIQKATEKLTKGRTSIVIAHRLSTIQQADCIVVLDKGRIIETGSHRELVRKGGYYHKLYEMQFFNNETNETI